MDNIQTNTRQGIVRLPSADLSGKNGLLAKLTSTGLDLPAALTDDTPYVVVDGGETESSVKPLNRGEQVRVFVKGACAMGDLLCAADPSTAADKGKLRKLPMTAGTYAVLAIAEEAGVDGQAVLVRAYNKSVTVASS